VAEDPKDWDVATKLIRGGIARSQFMETAEALYLTQGFTYDSAEAPTAASPARIRASSIRGSTTRP
jgi:hypothetical protein